MIETVYINWFQLLSIALFLLALAVILSLAIISFQLEKPIPKSGLWLSLGLVLTSLLLFSLQLPSGNVVAVKLTEPKTGLQLESIDDERSFSPKELKIDPQNKRHHLNKAGMKNNTMVLFWDGFIRTPFLRFQPGQYNIRFRAYGTEAKGAFPKIKVEFETPTERNYLAVTKRSYIQLSKTITTYNMPFQVNKSAIGRIRITYFNDLQEVGTQKGRDLWLDDVTIELVRAH